LEIVHKASTLKLPEAESGMLAMAGARVAQMVVSAKAMLELETCMTIQISFV